MGVGGINGELRDYLEYVDVIFCLYFNVINGRLLIFVLFFFFCLIWGIVFLGSSSLNIFLDGFEEMVCFSCSFNFILFKWKVIV